jgi:DNA-binding transcriptional ArsR family regulator
MSPRVNLPVAHLREARAAVPVFAALGDSTRMQIVGRLSLGQPLSIASLTAGTGVTRQAVTKHLKVLDDVGLVRSNWQGRERLWELEPARLDAARRSLDAIAAQWSAALDRLKSFVEGPE